MKAILTKINWFGLAGGITTIVVIITSMVYPWWQLTIGEGLIQANASPVNTNFGFLGTAFTVPFIWALNIVSLLTLVASGVAMLVYSVFPAKPFAKHLLGFGYKKPLFTLLFFVIGLLAITLILQSILSINVPLSGASTVTVPQSLTQGVTIRVLMSAQFQWTFWLAAVAAGLCIAARIYHRKVATAHQPEVTVTAATAAAEVSTPVPAAATS